MNRGKGVVLTIMALLLALPAWAGTFIDNGDGTVTDRATGLMWQRATTSPMTWKAAMAYCETLELAGHSDWRLPSREELRSLLDYSRNNPTIDTTAFPGTKSTYYWSATTYAVTSSAAWRVCFHDGNDLGVNKSNSHYVRAVRAGQSLGYLPTESPPHTLGVGSVMAILWDASALGNQDVAISLSRQGGTADSWETIAANAGATGTYAWTVTGPVTANGLLKIAPLAAPEQPITQGLFSIISVTLGSLSQTYDGTAKVVTSTTDPADMTVTFTYNGSETPPTNAGSYAVVGTISEVTPPVTASGTLVIGKATASLSLGGLSQTYDGTPKPATATTIPEGMAVTFTYDGAETPPTNAGSYTVVGTINDPNYQGSAAGTLVIQAAATATIALGGLSQTYDGTTKSATAATIPEGMAVSFTYNGSETPPTNAGSYAVVGTINDPNYQGTATGTLVIGKATAAVSLGGLSQTYDGTAKSATAATIPEGMAVSFTYNGSETPPTNAGSYAVVGTINDPNYQGTATGTLVIGKATAAVSLGGLSQTYDGTAKSATAATIPEGMAVSFTYNGSETPPTNAGSYAVVGNIIDTNYQGTTADTLVMGKATVAVSLESLSQTYDGTPKSATATTIPEGMAITFTYNGSETPPTNAGSYEVAGTINDSNYQGTATDTLVIDKATATLTLGGLSQTYDGTPKSATATTIPEGMAVAFTYEGAATPPTDAGSYEVVGTINDSNYQGTAAGTLVIIGKATATLTLGGLSQTYDGTPKSATATTIPEGMAVTFTYDGAATPPTNAGSYAVVGTINDPNYQGTAAGTLVIGKTTASISLGGLSQAYDGTAKSATATTIPEGMAVSFTYDGAETPPTNAGSYAVVGTIIDTNYQGTAAGTLVIQAAATATITLGGLSQTYDGTAKAATATTIPEGLSVAFTYDGAATPPSAAGSYAVVATINDNNYQGTASGTLVIGEATATLTLGGLSQTYDGTPKAVSATTIPEGMAVSFTYDSAATPPSAAGSYAVVATINDSNYQGTASGTLVIDKAPAAVSLGSLSQTYDGTAKSATAITITEGMAVSFTYNGAETPPTNAGSYAVVGTINDPNYQGTAAGTLVIGKTTAAVSLGGLSQTYDGTPKSATATTIPAGKTVTFTYNGSAIAPTDASSYAVVGTIDDTNYEGTASGTLVIKQPTVTVTMGGLSQTYDGTAKGMTVTFTYDGSETPPTNAGTYALVGTIREITPPVTLSGTLVIDKATATISLGGLSQTYDGTPKSATAITIPEGLIVTFTYNGSEIPPTDIGSYAVIGTINDTNYKGTTSGTLVIK